MITELVESARGCGYRKPGGLYLIGSETSGPCYRFPIELTVCPHCGQGIKFTRGFSWVSATLIHDLKPCKEGQCKSCDAFFNFEDRYGLMWVGEKYYPTPSDFIKESNSQGISKRIPFLPKDLVIGKTWVLLAHKKAVVKVSPYGEPKYSPGVFAAFKPTKVQYVVTGNESQADLERRQKKGIDLVKVIPDVETQMSLISP